MIRARLQSRWHYLRSHPIESYGRLRLGITAMVALAVVVGVTVFVNSLHLDQDTYRADFAQAAGSVRATPSRTQGSRSAR